MRKFVGQAGAGGHNGLTGAAAAGAAPPDRRAGAAGHALLARVCGAALPLGDLRSPCTPPSGPQQQGPPHAVSPPEALHASQQLASTPTFMCIYLLPSSLVAGSLQGIMCLAAGCRQTTIKVLAIGALAAFCLVILRVQEPQSATFVLSMATGCRCRGVPYR